MEGEGMDGEGMEGEGMNSWDMKGEVQIIIDCS